MISPQKLDELIEETLSANTLVLFNDEVNTFEHVVHCLVKYCDHNPYQAEQCALIAHYNGKCVIKKGSIDDLIFYQVRLTDQKLNVEIN